MWVVLLGDGHTRSSQNLDKHRPDLALHPSPLNRPYQGRAGQHPPVHRCYPRSVDTLDTVSVAAADAEPGDGADRRPAVPSHAVLPPQQLLLQLRDHSDSTGLLDDFRETCFVHFHPSDFSNVKNQNPFCSTFFALKLLNAIHVVN